MARALLTALLLGLLAHLLTDRLWVMVAATLAIGWFPAVSGHTAALAVDASIAGMMGLVAAACFALALFVSPKYGLLARRPAPGGPGRAQPGVSSTPV